MCTALHIYALIFLLFCFVSSLVPFCVNSSRFSHVIFPAGIRDHVRACVLQVLLLSSLCPVLPVFGRRTRVCGKTVYRAPPSFGCVPRLNSACCVAYDRYPTHPTTSRHTSTAPRSRSTTPSSSSGTARKMASSSGPSRTRGRRVGRSRLLPPLVRGGEHVRNRGRRDDHHRWRCYREEI